MKITEREFREAMQLAAELPGAFPMLVNMFVTNITPYLNVKNVQANGAQYVKFGMDAQEAYQQSLDDLRTVARRATARVHGDVDALIKGGTIPCEYAHGAHAIITAQLYYGVKQLSAKCVGLTS